ncbi:MAG: hypothetical protein JW944_02200 [Deltaproteobacteria bacterium]|nr:hypothetical protein [Deltaproteobacteria bacterium]
MNNADEWGRDPAVRAMRKIFKGMEDAQGEFFSRMGIHRYDPRIRLWREKALALFEDASSRANNNGSVIGENAASKIYLHCIARAMKSQGIEIPDEVLK